MFFFHEDAACTVTGEGVSRKVLAHDKDLMVVEVNFAAGGIGAPHSHPHKQSCYISRGEIEFNLDGEVKRMKAGDTVFIPSGVVHGLTALTDAIVVDIFTPMREDFIY